MPSATRAARAGVRARSISSSSPTLGASRRSWALTGGPDASTWGLLRQLPLRDMSPRDEETLAPRRRRPDRASLARRIHAGGRAGSREAGAPG